MNKEEFQKKIIEGKEEAFIDFYADWCGPCKMLAPIMEEISKTDKVYKINVDQEEELASFYGIMSIPCVIYFKDGEEKARSIGLKPKEEILSIKKD